MRELRNALGCYPTGVTILTAPDGEDGMVGITANSFSAVSLEPPLVLWSLDTSAYSLGAFTGAGYFAVNVLAQSQLDMAQHFATRQKDKFATVDYEVGEGGVALFEGFSARFECRTVATHDEGDHRVFVGEVIAFEYRPDIEPLVFTHGRYAEIVGHREIRDPAEMWSEPWI
ncbi:MAG: flavin reductase family protein [Acidobacteria bacterium]|nr:flavin reductase family protein [Acidobacteriota bacterium]